SAMTPRQYLLDRFLGHSGQLQAPKTTEATFRGPTTLKSRLLPALPAFSKTENYRRCTNLMFALGFQTLHSYKNGMRPNVTHWGAYRLAAIDVTYSWRDPEKKTARPVCARH